MSTFFPLLLFLAVLLIFITIGIWLSDQARERLLRWLHNQGYEDVRLATPPWMQPGPFFLRNKRGRGILRLTVRQKDGRDRSGWVMYPATLFIAQVADQDYRVRLVWDDEWDPNSQLPRKV